MQPQIIAGAGVAAVILHFVIRVLKSGQMSALLARLGLPAVPDKALPWISMGLGLAGGIADALVQGMAVGPALESAFAGLFAGTGAIALHETVGQLGSELPPSPPAPPAAK
jgi:hypothetical protein